MGKEARKLMVYNKSDIADHLLAKEFGAATEAIGLADFYQSSGDLMARELEGRKVTPDDKIRVGQHLRELSIKIGKPIDADGLVIEEEKKPTTQAERNQAHLDEIDQRTLGLLSKSHKNAEAGADA